MRIVFPDGAGCVVLVTPHIGYNTAEASANMLRIAIATVEAFARGERLNLIEHGELLKMGAPTWPPNPQRSEAPRGTRGAPR